MWWKLEEKGCDRCGGLVGFPYGWRHFTGFPVSEGMVTIQGFSPSTST